tara:strand:- start:1805 stop:2671 length:867 start_codon:yes stop_codon:yes gene_type:complete
MNNKSKIDISSSVRPDTSEIKVFDEYKNERSFPITGELPLTIYIDKQEIVTLMTLGHYPEALVIGYLRNQGIINQLSQLKSVHVDWSVNAAAVTTNNLNITQLENKLKHRVVTSGCGQGTTFGGIMDELKEKKVRKHKIKQSTIYSLLKKLHDKNEIYRRSGAVHGCALCNKNEILDFVEDVGRHNAVDAIAGHMWLNELEGCEKIFYTTGRLTSEMVIKVAQMNISVLLSRSGITEMGLNVAKETNVTLLGRAKGRHFLIYNGKENIEFDAIPDPRPEGSTDIWKRR